MAHTNVCIAVPKDHEASEQALAALKDAGFDTKNISVVGKDHADDKHIHGYYTTGESMKFWGKQGALWGGIAGALAGAGFLFVPGIGPLLVAGPLLSSLVGATEGAAVLGGIEAVFAGIAHLSLSKDSLVLYESQLKAGKCLVLVHGSSDDVVRAKGVLEGIGINDVTLHAA